MLVDDIDLIVKAGSGGNGAATFRSDAMTARGGPDGGDGGNGGNIYALGSTNVNDLREFRFKKMIRAENGTDGSRHNGFGKNAPHKTILLPLGTEITDTETGKKIEIIDTKNPVLLVQGGIGGRGNVAFKSPINRTPKFAEKGTHGEERTIHLELRFIADIGLIGLPNAGKSSLLTVLTHATPAIGAYPFTTLTPNIGMMGTLAIADIPGLIEGASSGKGLGIKFLKHIEKTKLLVHCIDVTVDNPFKVYETVRNEFKLFNPELLKKPEIVFINKTDLVDEHSMQKVVDIFLNQKKFVVSGSIYNMESVKNLREKIISYLQKPS
jgi:GTP-binding protein